MFQESLGLSSSSLDDNVLPSCLYKYSLAENISFPLSKIATFKKNNRKMTQSQTGKYKKYQRSWVASDIWENTKCDVQWITIGFIWMIFMKEPNPQNLHNEPDSNNLSCFILNIILLFYMESSMTPCSTSLRWPCVVYLSVWVAEYLSVYILHLSRHMFTQISHFLSQVSWISVVPEPLVSGSCSHCNRLFFSTHGRVSLPLRAGKGLTVS